MAELPNDLIIEIAKRLPVKSIARFKCISKTCNYYFSSPEFVTSHLHHSPERIILVDYLTNIPHIVSLTDVASGSSSEKLALKSPLYDPVLQACCNGLVLLWYVKDHSDYDDQGLAVINPATSRVMRVPLILSREMMIGAIPGLGYSSVDDDYKVVLLHCEASKKHSVKIFSLKTRGWKKSTHDSPYIHRAIHTPVYTDGHLYMLASSEENEGLIAAFDMSTERFHHIPSPAGFASPRHKLDVMGGSLALVVHMNTFLNVWIMEQPGSWTKFTINYPDSSDILQVISRSGEFEFVLAKNCKELVTYNCETRVWRNVDVRGLPKHFLMSGGGILSFRESLVHVPDSREDTPLCTSLVHAQGDQKSFITRTNVKIY